MDAKNIRVLGNENFHSLHFFHESTFFSLNGGSETDIRGTFFFKSGGILSKYPCVVLLKKLK